MSRTTIHKWTEEQLQFLRDNIKGTPYKEMHRMINERFGLNLTFNQVSGILGRHKLTNGIDRKFDKGIIPPNKGQKMSPELHEKMRATNTWFKKGHLPQNHKPLGSERVDKDGFTLIKTKGAQ